MARDVKVAIVGDTRGLKRAFDRAERDAEGFRGKMERTASRVGNAFKVAAPIAGAALAAFGVASVKVASDAAEAANVLGLAFGDAADDVEAFAEGAASSMGMSERAFMEAAGGIGALLKPMGVAEKEAAFMAVELTQRAADIGSAFNASSDEVNEAMKSALAGQAEPMRRFGVFLSEARIAQQGLAMGFDDVSQKGDLAARAMAIQAIIMQDSNMVAGDFANTLGESLPNKTKQAAATFENLQKEIGENLLPVAIFALDWILLRLDDIKAWWDEDGKQLLEDFKAGWDALGEGVDGFRKKLQDGETDSESFSAQFNQHMDDAGWGVDEFDRGLGDLKVGWNEIVTYFPIGARIIGDALHEIFVVSIWQSTLYPLLKGIGWVLTQIGEGIMIFGRSVWGVFQWIGDKIQWVLDKLGKIPGLLGDVVSLGEHLPGHGVVTNFIERFDTGGVVGGPIGSPQLVLAHGGETILPTHKQSMSVAGGDMGGDVYLDGDKVGRWMNDRLRDDRRSRG